MERIKRRQTERNEKNVVFSQQSVKESFRGGNWNFARHASMNNTTEEKF